MRLTTRLTIGDRTETFESSPQTLGTNLYVTLLIRGAGLAICKRIEHELLTAHPGSFRFHEGDIAVEADEVPPQQESAFEVLSSAA